MSALPHKKFKQALLPFKTTASPKKRKLDDEVRTDGAKCYKMCRNKTDSTDITPIDVDHPHSNKSIEENIAGFDHLSSSQLTLDLDGQARNVAKRIDLMSNDSNQSSTEVKDESLDSISCLDSDELALESNSASVIKLYTESSEMVRPNENKSSDDGSTIITFDEDEAKIAEAKNLLSKTLTPKQLKKKQEAELKRQDRERLKQEKEQKKQEEKEAKERKRLAELEIKNAEKRHKEEEKRLRALAKEEERKQKEEEKRQKEEERRQKDEEKRQKEEQERRAKEKTAAMFTNFFLKNKTVQTKNNKVEHVDTFQTRTFMPFEIKADMRLASVCRFVLTPEKLQYLDEILKGDAVLDKSHLYLAQLNSKNYKRGHSENTWPLNSHDDDAQIIPRYRCKLLQFIENRRPAYWGTWRKRSTKINGRRPFECDQFYFQYDVDSDDEWVEEEPGESLHGSDDEKESEDEYEVDNDVFVPHGYLSDEEAQNDDFVDMDTSPKSHKYKLNILEKEFEAEMSEKTRKLKPRIFGCLWISNHTEKNGASNEVENLLLNFRAIWNETQTPFCSKHTQIETFSTNTCISPLNMSTMKTKKRNDFPDSLLPDLIKLVHGNKINGQKLSEEFQTYALCLEGGFHLSKTCIQNKIKEISSWWPHKACWVVFEDTRKRHNLGELSLENHWKYVSTATQISAVTKKNTNTSCKTTINDIIEKTTTTTTTTATTTTATTRQQLLTPPKSEKTSPKIASITKFIKVLRPEEKEKQLKSSHQNSKIKSSSNSIPSDTEEEDVVRPIARPQIKKRAVLLSMEEKAEKSSAIDAECAAKPSNDDNYPLPLSFLASTIMSKPSSFDSYIEQPETFPPQPSPSPSPYPPPSECANPNTITKSLSNVEAMAIDDNCCQYSNQFDRLSEKASYECVESSRKKRELTNMVVASASLIKNNAEIRAGKKYAKLVTIGKANKE